MTGTTQLFELIRAHCEIDCEECETRLILRFPKRFILRIVPAPQLILLAEEKALKCPTCDDITESAATFLTEEEALSHGQQLVVRIQDAFDAGKEFSLRGVLLGTDNRIQKAQLITLGRAG